MGRHKKYDGYKSFQYLEPDVDYKLYKLAKEIDRVEPFIYPVSKTEEERVETLLENTIVISMHDHPVVFPEDMRQSYEYTRQGRWFTAFEGLSVSGLDAIFDNLMDGIAHITSQRGWKWTDVIHDLGMRLSDIAHQDFVIRGERVTDIITAHETGKVALIPTLESLTPIENELDRIDVLYGLGIRSAGVVYSEANALGAGLKEKRDGGLTDFGHEAVRRMNKLGIAVDASHAGDQTTLDTIESSNAPIFMSHAGASALWSTNRLMSNEVIQALAEKDGIIGIESATHTTLTKQHPKHNIESVMEHFEYCINLSSIQNVGFGPDTLFGDHVGLHHAYAAILGKISARAQQHLSHEQVEYCRGMENPAECFPNIIRWLVTHGYSDQDIKKVIGTNALRVLKAAWRR